MANMPRPQVDILDRIEIPPGIRQLMTKVQRCPPKLTLKMLDALSNIPADEFQSKLDTTPLRYPQLPPSRERQRLLVSTLALWPTLMTG